MRNGKGSLVAFVHDSPAMSMERLRVLHWLGEEVRRVLVRGDVGHNQFEGLDHVAHKEVAALHVLHAVMVLWVVRDITRALAIGGQLTGACLRCVETAHEFAQVHDVLGSLGQRDDFRLAG